MYKFKLFFAAVMLLSIQIFAQENSPYSRYGIGLQQARENIANRGMGGASIADRSISLINPSNPASYSALKLTSYQLGLSGSMFTIRNNNQQSSKTGGFGLSYVNLAFPVGKSTAISFGLLPYSKVNYSMRQLDSVPDVSQVEYNFFGEGSVQKVYFGAAHEYKGFSIGANVGYIFGSYFNNTSATFTDSLEILDAHVLKRTRLSGLAWDLGVGYHYKYKNERFINVGATFSNQTNLKSTAEQDWYQSFGFPGSTSPYNFLADSLREFSGNTVVPSNLGVGVQWGNGDKWKAGLDYIRSDWSQFRSFDQPDSFATSSTIRLGGEFTPDVNDKFNIWKRVTYRAGAYTRNEPLKLNGVQLKSQAVTVGVGYPIVRTLRSIGQVNAAFELGKRGTLEADLVQENYSRFSIGVTLNDRWFMKRRYD